MAEGDYVQCASQKTDVVRREDPSLIYSAITHPLRSGGWKQKSRWNFQGIVHRPGSRGSRDGASGKLLLRVEEGTDGIVRHGKTGIELGPWELRQEPRRTAGPYVRGC